MSNIIEEKLKEGLPLIVDFGSDTCVPCKMIKPVLEEIAKEYEGKLNILILNVNEHLELARNLGVMSIPSQFFYDKDGRLIGNHVGFIPKEAFEQIIEEHLGIKI